MELFCRARKTFLSRHFEKSLELIEIHLHPFRNGETRISSARKYLPDTYQFRAICLCLQSTTTDTNSLIYKAARGNTHAADKERLYRPIFYVGNRQIPCSLDFFAFTPNVHLTTSHKKHTLRPGMKSSGFADGELSLRLIRAPPFPEEVYAIL